MFQPYSGVKTSVIFIDRAVARKTDDVLFVKVNGDGFNLGATRKASSINDLPSALLDIKMFMETGDVSTTLSHTVNREAISESGDFSLLGDRYLAQDDFSDSKWPMVRLDEVAKLVGGATPSRSNPDYWGGEIPWLTATNISTSGEVEGYQGITEKAVAESSTSLLPIGSTILVSRVSVGKSAYVQERECALNQDLTGLIPLEGKVLPRYLFYVTRPLAEKIEREAVGVGVRGVTRAYIAELRVPLPPIEVQANLINELDSYSAKIAAANDEIVSYRKSIKDTVTELWKS